MKSILIIILATLLTTAHAESVQINWSEVAEKVKTSNYTIEENRLRVSQAKEYANYSRLSLLPKLNLFKILNITSVNGGLVGLVEDLVPFLIPANWLKAKQSKILAESTKNSYQALWGNEILNAKILFTTILNEQNFLKNLTLNHKTIEELYLIAEARSEIGQDDLVVKNHLESLLIQSTEDIRLLKLALMEEKNRLLFLMGENTSKDIVLSELGDIPQLGVNEDKVKMALELSPELKSYDNLIAVSESISSEILFSFLGGSSIARGFDGGVFGNVPIDGGMGASTPSQIRISKMQKEILIKQRKAVEEMIKLQWTVAVKQSESLVIQKESSRNLYKFAMQRIEYLKDKMYLGQKINLADFTDAIQSASKATAYLYLTESETRQTFTKMERMLWAGDFEGFSFNQ